MDTDNDIFSHTIQALEEFAEYFVEIYKQNLLSDGRYATGNFVNTIKINPITISTDTITVTLNVQEYWKDLEYGRPRTEKNGDGIVRKKIREWLEIKKLPLEPRISQKTGKVWIPKNYDQLSFLIARAIHEKREGAYQGKNSLERTKEEVVNMFEEKIQDALSQDIAELIDNSLPSIFT